MNKRGTPQSRDRVASTRRMSVSAFMNIRVLPGVVMLFGAVLVALFAAARQQVPTHERAVPPNRFSSAPSSSVQEAWVVRYDRPQHSADSANDLAIDASGNVYVTGGSAVSGGPPDYVTIKYNSAGEQQWIADFSGGNNTANFANAIALDDPDADGNCKSNTNSNACTDSISNSNRYGNAHSHIFANAHQRNTADTANSAAAPVALT
jgi:hypothetical protein